MCLCKTKLPRKTCIVDWTSRCCSGTSIISRDKDNCCPGFCNTGCYSTYSGLWNKLNWYSRIFITILQVIDKLSQVLDRIDVMMWRRWDKTYTRCWMSCLCNPWINLSSRKMSSLTRFCSLCHLNLDFLCTYKITRCYTKTTWCNLLYCWTSVLRLSCSKESVKTLTTLTTVWFTMKMIHCNGKCFMCLLWNRTVRHCSCLKSLNNLVNTLNLIDWNAFLRIIKVKHTSECYIVLFFIYTFWILFKQFIASCPCSLL